MINSSLSSKCNNNIHCSSKPQSPQAMKLVACLRFIYCVHLAKSFLDAITQFKRASRMKIRWNQKCLIGCVSELSQPRTIDFWCIAVGIGCHLFHQHSPRGVNERELEPETLHVTSCKNQWRKGREKKGLGNFMPGRSLARVAQRLLQRISRSRKNKESVLSLCLLPIIQIQRFLYLILRFCPDPEL